MYQIYQQDNLEIMKSLPDNQINLIYCDILYGTGRNFGEYQDLKADRKTIEEHYFPRLIQMKRIMKTDGNIYIHCDNKIVHWIRCLMDDVFGYDKFINEIIWWYNSAPRKKGHFANRHDNILRYSKNKEFYFDEDCEEIRKTWLSYIKPIILSSCPKDGLVADFYMGSGTTGEVALENGRNFIGCDIGKGAYEITKNRLKKYD